MILRALIVDDEPLARQGVRDLLVRERDIEIAGECRNGHEALEALKGGGYDLVLLDVQMPELSGFEVLRELRRRGIDPPTVVFVTAYDEYALAAFQVHAIDYLLKPIEPERFAAAIQRARKLISYDLRHDMTQKLVALLDDLDRRETDAERLLIKARGRSFFVNVDDIDWIEAEGNYAALHIGQRTHLIRETMGALHARLAYKGFARIHRSTIVNLDRVVEIQPWFKGDHLVILRDGTQLSLTRKYRRDLEQRLGGKL